jgi:hypothetical protein
MSFRVPVGGLFASIYYDFETAFKVYDNPYDNPKYYLGINKYLGQGIKITSWERNNDVQLVRGLNSLEATSAVDGAYSGSIAIDVEMVGDMGWMEALMGTKLAKPDDSTVLEYYKGGTPKTMTFVVYIQNDSADAQTGDAFVLKGCILENVELSIEQGNTPLHAKLNVLYADETPIRGDDGIGIIDIPLYPPLSDDVFNFGQAVAYFWNPGSDTAGVASFDSMEVVVEKFSLTISHGATMLRGIGSRKARDKFFTYLDYKLSLTAIYRDKERFLEKFYGCREGPVDDTVKPYEEIKLVVQNNYSCSDSFKRLEFDLFKNKVNTYTTAISLDEAIKEDMNILPFSLIAREYSNATAEPELHISPYHVKQGDLISFIAMHFPAGQEVSFYMDDELMSGDPFLVLTANCIGEIDYKAVADATTWDIGEHTITAGALSGLTPVSATTSVYVTTPDGLIPKLVVCPAYFGTEVLVAHDYEGISLAGYNFGEGAMASFTGTITVGGVSKTSGFTPSLSNLIAYTSTETGMMKLNTGTLTTNLAGEYVFELTQTMSNGDVFVARDYMYITYIEYTAKAGDSQEFKAHGMKPGYKAYLYINDAYKGFDTAADDGTATITLTYPTPTPPSVVVKFRQSVVTSHGTVEIVAQKTITIT